MCNRCRLIALSIEVGGRGPHRPLRSSDCSLDVVLGRLAARLAAVASAFEVHWSALLAFEAPSLLSLPRSGTANGDGELSDEQADSAEPHCLEMHTNVRLPWISTHDMDSDIARRPIATSMIVLPRSAAFRVPGVIA